MPKSKWPSGGNPTPRHRENQSGLNRPDFRPGALRKRSQETVSSSHELEGAGLEDMRLGDSKGALGSAS